MALTKVPGSMLTPDVASTIPYTQGGVGAVERTVAARLRDYVSVKDFGAVGDGVTDDTAAIQAAIDSIDTGLIYFPAGRYKISSTLSVNKAGISLIGESPCGQGAVTGNAISEIVASGTMTVAVRFGDPTESSGYGAHIYPGGSIQNLSITGTVNTTSGVRVYNITVHVKDCYISNVVGSNGIGLWFGSAWLSTVQDTVIQSNAGYDLWLGDASNSVMLMNCTFLSTNTSEGVHIVGGSNSITILNCDFEGKKHGIAIDTSSATIDSLSIKGCNFESNTTFGITSTGAQPLNACSIENCRASGAGNGINLNYFNALRLDQLFMFDCDIAFGQVGQSSDIGKLHLTGTAALTGQTSSIRRRKITEPLYEENSTVGALAYTIDSSQYNTLELVLSAACTGVTFTTNNASKRGVGEELLFVIGNGGTATVGGAVAFPAAYKVTSSVVIPAANKRTSIRFVKDSNNLWWESSRATDAG